MKQQVFKYLKSYSTLPFEVDRLIVSAFVELNNISLKNNEFIKSYLIDNDDSSEQNALENFIKILKEETQNFSLEILIELFEFVISPSDRIINGAIYTPDFIRNYIVEKSLFSKKNLLKNLKIADISCGCGAFLLTAAQKLKKKTKKSYKSIFKDNIYGLDIQDYSTNRTKILLSILALLNGEDEKEFHFNLFTDDALTFDWKNSIQSFNGFDIILGNPPYVRGRNLPKSTITKLKQFKVCNSGNPDLYIPFFQLGIENLNETGFFGIITMNSFFKSLNGRNLREYFKQKSLNFIIIDFGTERVFKSKNAYTCICLIENKKKSYIKYYKSLNKSLPQKESEFSKIPYKELPSKSGWNLNDFKTIQQIETTGTPFGELFKTRYGIATLKNDIYIFKPVREDKDYFYLQNGKLYPIEKNICRDIINNNKLSRKVEFDDIKEKVIFPYTNDRKPKLLDENFLEKTYPMAYKYLKDKRDILAKRDKGNGIYKRWFAFGRTQSLEKVKNKLFFPKFTDKIPNYIIKSDDNLMYYNGQAIIGHNEKEMIIIKKLMESSVFWYYIKTTSKPYASNYYSLNGTYIKNFGVCNLNEEEEEFILQESNKLILNEFFENKYKISLCHNVITDQSR